MAIVILGASGGTGRHLVRQAVGRGLEVRALYRDPAGADPSVPAVRADVADPSTIAAAIGPDDVVVSALGVRRRAEAGTLTAGARAVVAARPRHIVWLGAMGTGPSARKIGGFTRRLLRLGFGAEYADKVAGDAAILDAGGTIVHSGPLSDRPDDPKIALLPLDEMPQQFFPAGAPRASIARLMLDAALAPAGGVLAVKP